MSKIALIMVEEMQGPCKYGQTFHPYCIPVRILRERGLLRKSGTNECTNYVLDSDSAILSCGTRQHWQHDITESTCRQCL